MNIRNILKSHFDRQTPHPTYADLKQLGRAIEWRTALLRSLPITRAAAEPFPFIIQRQIEDELDRYQREINDLSDDLGTGEIDNDEFERRLRNLTIAILLLAFLRGSQRTDVAMPNLALEVIRSGGQTDIEPDWSQIPPEAVEELQNEIDISILAAANLGGEIMAGLYENRGGVLASRLAMWATTALGVYGLGRLWQENEGRLQIWEYGPTKEHCFHCRTLRGQVHTIAAWREFFLRTRLRPQSRDLACKGYNCLCGIYDTDELESGGFV